MDTDLAELKNDDYLMLLVWHRGYLVGQQQRSIGTKTTENPCVVSSFRD